MAGILDRELAPDLVGDLELLLEAPPALSGAPRRPGESLTSWGQRLQAGDRANTATAKSRTRSGAATAYNSAKHPRGRGGKWTTVGQGASGQEVRGIQRRVGAKTDGQFGHLTRRAVMAFQRKHGLKADGVVGHQTSLALAGRFALAKRAKAGALTKADLALVRSLPH